MKLKLPKKSDMKVIIPDIDILEKVYEKGIRVKRTIDMLNKSIKVRQEKIKELNNTDIMKQYRTHKLIIETTNKHISAYYKQFKNIFDL